MYQCSHGLLCLLFLPAAAVSLNQQSGTSKQLSSRSSLRAGASQDDELWHSFAMSSWGQEEQGHVDDLGSNGASWMSTLHEATDLEGSANQFGQTPTSDAVLQDPFGLFAINSSLGVACDKHLKMHPDDISCPAACPFVRAEPTRLCQFKCVPATSCNSDNPLASFANPETKRCETCKVAGCYRCGQSNRHCAQCMDGFSLISGTCKSAQRHYWHALWIVCGILGSIVLYYVVVLLFFRKEKEEGKVAMKAAEHLRSQCIVRHMNTQTGRMEKLKLSTDLGQVTNSKEHHKNPVLGPGVMLHFRWFAVIFVWSLFGLFLYGLAGSLFWDKLSSIVFSRPHSRASYDACTANVAQRKDDYNTMEGIYFLCITIMYLVTFMGSLYLAADQRRTYNRVDLHAVTHKDFCIHLDGLPTYGGRANVEDIFLRHFRKQEQFQGLTIVGISVAWNYRSKKDLIQQHLRKDAAHHEMHSAFNTELRMVKENTDKEEKRSCADPELRVLDVAFGIGPGSEEEKPEEKSDSEMQKERKQPKEIQKIIEDLRTTGQAFLVMGSMEDKDEALRRIEQKKLIYDHNGSYWKIRAMQAKSEPLTILWHGFGTEHTTFMVNVILGCIVVFLAVLILDLFFYAPYVIYILSLSDVPGMSQGTFLSSTFLGLLITVCNVIIYNLIGMAADRCGWTSSDAKDCYYCVKYTLAVFFNTCVDLVTVLLIAQGYSVDQAIAIKAANDSTMSPKALAESPDIQKAMYAQLVAYIWPSCVLVPFLLEPIVGTFVPKILISAAIRSRDDVSIQDAEELLELPPYDLSRYGDILVNMMLVCATLAFTYIDLWWMFLAMIISLLIIHAWDQCRALRYTRKTIINNPDMDNAVMYMMALPCATLLGCVVFKAYSLLHNESNTGMKTIQDMVVQSQGMLGLSKDRYTAVCYVIAAWFGHLIVHWIVLREFVIPRVDKEIEAQQEEEPKGEYSHTAMKMPASYFNTNPIQCLRSRLLYHHGDDPDMAKLHDPPCVFYFPGKEALLRENKELGLHFKCETQDYENEEEQPSAKVSFTKALSVLGADARNFAGGVD